MKVRIKIKHCSQWHGRPLRQERYWVHLSTGQYFPIFSGVRGWTNMYTQHSDYRTPEEAIESSLRILFAPKEDDYRKSRIKEQVFTFNHEKFSRIKLPRKKVTQTK